MINESIKNFVSDITFSDISKDMRERAIMTSPVFRLTNCKDDIQYAIKVTLKAQEFLQLFPDNKLLKELLL